MSETVAVMQRYELKYLLDPGQTGFLRRRLEGRMQADGYGRTAIASLYCDTPDFRLIRASMENSDYKEKLRLRSYGLASETSPVFLELKRKAYGVVYKRRVQTALPAARRFLAGDGSVNPCGQIDREIAAFRDHYGTLAPACLIIYDRTAYVQPGSDLRLTIDEAPRYRMDDLSLTRSMAGELLLPEGWTILEIKVQQAMPLWLARTLSEGGIRKTRFSKYGEAYRRQALAGAAGADIAVALVS